MNTETMLARVNEIRAHFNPNDRQPAHLALDALADDLAAQLRAECAASKGVGSAAKAVQRLLTQCRKGSHQTALHYAWMDDAGRQCVCDGYRAFRLTEPLPLEDRPEDADKPIDLDKIFAEFTPRDYTAVPLPDAGEVKAQIALQRAKDRKALAVWDFGKGLPAVNAAFLLDLLTVLPDAREIFVRKNSLLSPLFARSERGDAILLPIRTPAKAADESAAEWARRDFRAQVEGYRRQADADPRYSVTPDDFERLSRHAWQPAA